MKIIVNYPKSKEGIKKLNIKIGYLHAYLVLKAIEDLDIDDTSKRKIIKNILSFH